MRAVTITCTSSPSSPPGAAAEAQHPHILYTLVSEFLAAAEHLDDAEARRRWARWANAVFLQMHMEADVDAWRVRVGVARGQCWLVIGSAHVDEMEDELECGDASVVFCSARRLTMPERVFPTVSSPRFLSVSRGQILTY